MASIALAHVTKTFANGHVAVGDVTLTADDGELLVLVGPSGSGKSTVLRLIAGLERPTSGRIAIDAVDVTDVPPERRDLAMVFQHYALYPHKTVRDNLAFGLAVRRVPRREVRERVHSVAAALGIETLLDRRPAQLSGGQRQRVALGRAIVREPRAFLLDEPLSSLDPQLRVETRTELALLHRRLGATMIHVTHDQEEAMTLGDRVAVMRDGRLEQVATPMEIFRRPANVFIAGFFGSPAMNVWRSRVAQTDDGRRLVCGALALDAVGPGAALQRDVVLTGVRPHDIEFVPADTADAVGRVVVVEPLGATAIVHLDLGAGFDGPIRVVAPGEHPYATGEQVGIRIRRERVHLFDAGTGAALAPEAASHG